MTFSEQIVYAMFRPSKYKEMIQLKTRRAVAFIFVLMLVLGIVTFLIPLGAIITGFGGFETLFSKRISPMEYSDGRLSIEKDFEMSIGVYHFLIDTEEPEVAEEKLERDGLYIAFGSEAVQMTIRQGELFSKYQAVTYKDMGVPNGFNNASLCDMIPTLYVLLGISFLSTCIGFFLKYGLFALVLGICVNSMSKRMELHLSFGQVFMICFYGQTLGIILSNFNAALGLLPTMLVSLIGVFISIHMITTSLLLMNPTDQV